ncbi:MAG: hypothetical protein SF187_16800 [Deltaproteobacteria bacterium]|nr:hypothetical protein [Deltaproteobacteria bacterium]
MASGLLWGNRWLVLDFMRQRKVLFCGQRTSPDTRSKAMRVPVGGIMRKVALAAAFLSATVVAGCGDDLPSNIDANVVVADGGGGNTGEGGVLPDAGCPSATFISPVPAAKLTAADDVDDQCKANGFQIDVKLAVGAPDGTPVTLLANNTPVGTPGVVTGGTVTFAGVSLATSGASALVAQIGNATGCTASNTVDINCSAVTCNITKPVISEAHPKLNDVPVAEGGDRVSSPGSDYQAAFEVTTNAGDNSVVQLQVRRADAPDAVVNVNATVLGGKANFPGVALRPDGAFQIQAVCRSGAVEGRSQLGTFTVDTAKPDLTVTSPIANQFYGPSTGPGDLDGKVVNGKFKVCASTMAADATNVGMAINGGKNLGAAIGTSAMTYVPVAVGGSAGSGCVELDCLGGAPFSVNVSLRDDAGNVATKSIAGVTCASALPGVQIVQPVSDSAPYTDPSKHLLAANATQAFKDNDPAIGGAQTLVVACTDKKLAKAKLFVGVEGGALDQVGSEVDVVDAVTGDGCPAGLGFVAKWPKATLRDSTMNTAGGLISPTQLRVEVTEVSSAKGQSPIVSLWVDSTAPTADPRTPACGTLIESTVDQTRELTLITSSALIKLVVTSNGAPAEYDPTSILGSVATFSNVLLKVGENVLTAVVRDPAGNQSGLSGAACAIKVGTPPIVNFVSPATNAKLCAVGGSGCVADADGATDGWQGTVTVSVTVAGTPATTGTVTLSKTGGDAIGTSNVVNGVATFSSVTIPEGTVAILAATSEYPSAGVGTTASAFTVDSKVPSAVASLSAEILTRRESSFKLRWTAPDDNGQPAAAYDIRVSEAPLTEGNFSAAEALTFAGVPAASGQAEALDVRGRKIEADYYFGVVPVDAAGNRGPLVKLDLPTRASFNRTILSPPSIDPDQTKEDEAGYSVSGYGDLNGDGRGDVIVGTRLGKRVLVYFGTAMFSPDAPSLTITGTSAGFGRHAMLVGDVVQNPDEPSSSSKPDLAVASSANKMFIFAGRTTWPATLSEADADFVIDGAGSSGLFGYVLAPLGDFDSDGIDDLAIGNPTYASKGRVVILRGSKSMPDTVSVPDAARTILIDGSAANGLFGLNLQGLGKFYSGAGASLVVGADRANSDAGKVYVYKGQAALSGSITSFDASIDGSPGSRLGGNLATLGPVNGSTNAIGLASLFAGTGVVQLYFGNETAGPLGGTSKSLTNASAVGTNQFGIVTIGGAFSGSVAAFSLIGNDAPDIVVAPTREGSAPGKLYVLDGSQLGSLAASSDVTTAGIASVVLPLPNGENGTRPWLGNSSFSRLVRDVDGDGYVDLAIGEGSLPASDRRGRVLVFW